MIESSHYSTPLPHPTRIRGEPAVIDYVDGEPRVLDQEGYELVVRTDSGKTEERRYHHPDPGAALRGDTRILCRYGRLAFDRKESRLLWRRRDAIDAVWRCCENCASDDPETIGGQGDQEGPKLANQLESDDELREKVNAALEGAGGEA